MAELEVRSVRNPFWRYAALAAGVLCGLGPSGATGSTEDEAVPDFLGSWSHVGAGFSGPLPGVGPGPLTNISGTDLSVGNYDSPILQPWAAAAVKKYGDTLLAGKLAPNAHTSCYPMGLPYVLEVWENVQLLQAPEWITITYQNDNQRRQIHLNAPHTANPKPSWFGESVGHYEGDALIVDTIGIAAHEFSAVDRFGTPHTEAMHVVERYRVSGDRRTMRVDFSVEDPGTFNAPWYASVSYGRGTERPGEHVCAENNRESAEGQALLPVAAKPDF